MTFFKKAILAPFALIAAAASVQVNAAPIVHVIQLEASIPTTDFYVEPVDTSWPGVPQRLNYTSMTGELSQLSKAFNVKSTGGAVSAVLLQPAQLTSAADRIDLTVKFNRTDVTDQASAVVSAAEGLIANQYNLEIIPTRPTAGYLPGEYSGNVQVSFDVVI